MNEVHGPYIIGPNGGFRIFPALLTSHRSPRFSYKGEYVVQTLERICKKVGYPKTIRVIMEVSLFPKISICGLK